MLASDASKQMPAFEMHPVLDAPFDESGSLTALRVERRIGDAAKLLPNIIGAPKVRDVDAGAIDDPLSEVVPVVVRLAEEASHERLA